MSLDFNTSAATAATDFRQLLESCLSNEDDIVNRGLLVSRLADMGCTVLQIAAPHLGLGANGCHNVKIFELIPRTSNMILTMMKELEQTQPGWKGTIKVILKGAVAPLSDEVRVAMEIGALEEKYLLDLPPEESKHVMRPVYERDGNEWIITGYKPYDRAESQAAYDEQSAIAKVFVYTRLASDMVPGIPDVYTAGKNLYERLFRYLKVKQPEKKEFDLLALTEIPDMLRDDVVFSKYCCVISTMPARFPVGDPISETGIYDKKHILNWLAQSKTSPLTKKPLNAQQLVPKPALQALIDARLKHHQKKLWEYIQDNPTLVAELNKPADAALQNAANAESPKLN